MSTQINFVKRYVSLVESLELNEVTAKELLHPEYLQWELPNILNKLGQKSDVADSLKRMATARAILSSHKYDITSTFELGSTVIIETQWKGTMAIETGPFKKRSRIESVY